MSPFAAEIIGTMLLMFIGNGVVANVLLKETKGNSSGWVVITLAWGLAVYVAVVVAGPYSGAHINPAVTLSLAIAGKFAWSMVGQYLLAQAIGAAIGVTLVWLMYRDHYLITDDTNAKLATFCTGPAIRNPLSNLLSEALGTFVLILGVLYIIGPEMTIDDAEVAIGLGSIGALPIALFVTVIGMGLGGTTGYAINPARDLIPRIMHTLLPMGVKRDSDWSYAWVPVIGPLVGAAAATYLFLWLQ